MNISVVKYALRTKAYSMTISLTNRVIPTTGISNLSAELYWKVVYVNLNLTMASETTSFLQSEDTSQFYKKEYKEGTDVKSKRVDDQNRTNKGLWKNKKIDKNRGMTYGSGVTFDTNTIPIFIKETEKKEGYIRYWIPFFWILY